MPRSFTAQRHRDLQHIYYLSALQKRCSPPIRDAGWRTEGGGERGRRSDRGREKEGEGDRDGGEEGGLKERRRVEERDRQAFRRGLRDRRGQDERERDRKERQRGRER